MGGKPKIAAPEARVGIVRVSMKDAYESVMRRYPRVMAYLAKN